MDCLVIYANLFGCINDFRNASKVDDFEAIANALINFNTQIENIKSLNIIPSTIIDNLKSDIDTIFEDISLIQKITSSTYLDEKIQLLDEANKKVRNDFEKFSLNIDKLNQEYCKLLPNLVEKGNLTSENVNTFISLVTYIPDGYKKQLLDSVKKSNKTDTEQQAIEDEKGNSKEAEPTLNDIYVNNLDSISLDDERSYSTDIMIENLNFQKASLQKEINELRENADEGIYSFWDAVKLNSKLSQLNDLEKQRETLKSNFSQKNMDKALLKRNSKIEKLEEKITNIQNGKLAKSIIGKNIVSKYVSKKQQKLEELKSKNGTLMASNKFKSEKRMFNKGKISKIKNNVLEFTKEAKLEAGWIHQDAKRFVKYSTSKIKGGMSSLSAKVSQLKEKVGTLKVKPKKINIKPNPENQETIAMKM